MRTFIVAVACVVGCGPLPQAKEEPVVEQAGWQTTDSEFIRYKDHPEKFVGKTLSGRFRYSANRTLKDWIGESAYFSRDTSIAAVGTSVDISIKAELPKELDYPNVTRFEEVDIVFQVREPDKPVLLLSIKRAS